jgi:Cadherin-like domain
LRRSLDEGTYAETAASPANATDATDATDPTDPISVDSPPASSSADSANSSRSAAPNAPYTEVNQFGQQTTATATASLTVQSVNDAPTVQGERLATNEDSPLIVSSAQLLANDTDPDGDTLSISAVGAAVRGTVSLNAQGQVTFTPEANYHGPASFAYTVQDSEGASRSAVATLDIAAVNDAPTARADSVSTLEDQVLVLTPAQLLGNDSDADGSEDTASLKVQRVGNAEHGQVSLDAQGNVREEPRGLLRTIHKPNSPAAQSISAAAAINSGANKRRAANESGYRMTA